MINNRIDEEIDNKFSDIENIDSNDYNENEHIICKVISKRKTFADFKKYIISKYDSVVYINLEISNILEKTSKEYFEKQQQATTKTIKFNGRKPRTFVLKRLEIIAVMLSDHKKVIFTNRELKQIINDALDNPDDRTIEPYYDCMVDYAKQNGQIQGGLYEVKLNMRGFSDTVRELLGNKIC